MTTHAARGWLRKRREKRRRDAEIVGLLWWWDRPVPMTRAFAEWGELHLLPFGVSVLRDDRGRASR